MKKLSKLRCFLSFFRVLKFYRMFKVRYLVRNILVKLNSLLTWNIWLLFQTSKNNKRSCFFQRNDYTHKKWILPIQRSRRNEIYTFKWINNGEEIYLNGKVLEYFKLMFPHFNPQCICDKIVWALFFYKKKAQIRNALELADKDIFSCFFGTCLQKSKLRSFLLEPL